MFSPELESAINATLSPADQAERAFFYANRKVHESGPVWFTTPPMIINHVNFANGIDVLRTSTQVTPRKKSRFWAPWW